MILQTLCSIGPPEVNIERNVMFALPGYTLSCSASGVAPIYTTLTRNSTVLANTTNTASIKLLEDGNYTCVATNKFGASAKEISVIFFGKGFSFASWRLNLTAQLILYGYSLKVYLSLKNLSVRTPRTCYNYKRWTVYCVLSIQGGYKFIHSRGTSHSVSNE